MKNLFILFSFFILFGKLDAQYIVNGTDTLFGNEWIKFDQSYIKIKVAQDAMYRLTGQTLTEAGIPIGQITGTQYQLWYNGQELPIYTSTNGTFGTADFIDFYGQKNTSELDRFLFSDPDSMMMNPMYSMFTDTSAYFLTWVQSTNNLRFTNAANNLTNLPNPDSYYMEDFVLNYSNRAFKEATADNISFSNFTMSEGFSSDYALTSNHVLTPTSIYNGNIGGSLQLRFSGRYVQHTHEVSLNDQVVHTANYFGFQVQNPFIDISNSQLSGSMTIKVSSPNGGNDFHRVSNIILTYPRLFDFEQKTSHSFKVGPSSNVKYLEIANFNSSSGQAVLYDITNRLRIEGILEGGLVKLALPPSVSERHLLLVNATAGVVIIPALDEVNFINYGELDHDFIIVTSKRLLDDGNGKNYVQEYANYRASSAGGNFNPIVVNIEELYDQFSWGIEWHPFAVRNFGHFAKKNWSNTKYYFIIGKGREYPSHRSPANLSSALSSGFFVPTYSFPGSDNLLLAGPDRFTPIIPIGRLAALKPKDVSTYLQKVKEFEANSTLPQDITSRAWMKNVLHMGGGLTQGEQSSIKSGLLQMEEIIEGPSFGAEVKSFYKTSTDPIQVSQTDQIFDYINNGTSIISFFGHSAVGTFDFSIDNPDNFNNKGKYPLLISLGCYSGNIHSSSQGIGERFCFFEDKAAIAFAATSGQGYIGSLNNFASKLYQALGGSHYGKGVGDAMQSVILGSNTVDFGLNLIRQQFNLHGDPSLTFGAAPGPDYLVDGSTFSITPDRLNTQMANFEAKFELVNLGKAVADSLLIKVNRELPDGSLILVSEELVAAPFNRLEYVVSVPMLGKLAHGFNKLLVTVDDGNRIAELPMPQAEQNNELFSGGTLGHTFYISDNGVECVYPTDFAIVGNPDVELIASTSEPLTPERMYVFQMDTTTNFNSPLLIEHKITQGGGVLKWKPTTNLQHEMVYYWRISPDSISPLDGYVWDNSSFVFLNTSTGGWNQSHFYQWKKNEFIDIELKTHDNLKFVDNFKDVFLRNAVNTVDLINLQFNNAFKGRFWSTIESGIYVIVFDSISANEWLNGPPYSYSLPPNPGNLTWSVPSFIFDTKTKQGRQQLITFLKDIIPSNNYVLLHTVQGNLSSSYMPETWESDQPILGTDIFQLLEEQGATEIRNTLTTGSLPYVFAYKKDVGPIKEVLADSLKEVLRVNISIPGNWDSGSMVSPTIGPAQNWSNLKWEIMPSTYTDTDSISLDLLAFNPISLADTVLISNLSPGEFDLATVSATDYPYLRLRFNVADSIERTSPQMDYWRILYEGVPDFAVNPSLGYSFNGETIEAGEPLKFSCRIENLSDIGGDSLLVKYTVRSSSNLDSIVFKRENKMTAHDSLMTYLDLETKDFSGNYSLMLELNPGNEQAEYNRTNNILNTNFKIENDKRNPLLNVTFDGIHILDGDLVSSKPLIKINLKDENPFLLLNDTSLIRLFVTLPDSQKTQQRIYFDDPNLVFNPAENGTNNKASIEFRPFFTEDGEYQLIVQARDASNNQSGQYAYKTRFKIITKSSISNFLNYPNPFTTSTRFVYTMTGAEPPANYKVQIMTIAGQIVKELTQDVLGPLKVGTHQTDYAWDGTDEYGDRLANGVYLYRISVQDAAGKDWDGFNTSADKFFNKGFGKMVLLR